ncbi:hypothetical protein J0S82_013703, partial [Galemys pyrenaicus]
MKKLSTVTRNMDRCSELRFEWQGQQEKLATSIFQWNPNWQDKRYQCCEPKIFSGNFVKLSWGLWSYVLLPEVI